ncbi:hypothetical protein [Arundinibacter roseus]|uniref:Outer membrane protein beta-barrel domain-containing protein n=1 Tax=Arundinibacter roseus TaxID=2070510 RepID=A0A4V2X8I7_9BACT|nr:hypothetical protein [Arundinibacter roseus]TDB60015.1 hypothetical protein EZE20_21315 [Arundinibacter roseus]
MKKLCVLYLVMVCCSPVIAQDNFRPRLKKWFIPDHSTVQFAGNIGFLAVGPGYKSANQKLEIDILLGYLPQSIGGTNLTTLTVKSSYSPWHIELNDTYEITPLTVGALVGYTPGNQFSIRWPGHYPRGYYWWSTALRPAAFAGGAIERSGSAHRKVKHIKLYYEIGSYDLLLISYIQNRKILRLSDVTNLALGIKMGF